jgi:hypothetical protein
MPPVVEYFKKSKFTLEQVQRHVADTKKISNVTSCTLEDGTDKDGDPAWIVTTQYRI